MLYIRQIWQDRPWNRKHFPFRTKLELAAELVAWVCQWLRFLGKAIWVVTDGAYAKRPFVKAVLQAGVVLVSRLPRDAALWNVPAPARSRPGPTTQVRHAGHQPGQTCRPCRRLAAGDVRALQQASHQDLQDVPGHVCRGGGLIRVVLVREKDGWVAYFCTDAAASVEQILTAVADRGAIEQDFHDLKEVHGAGQQQVRHIFANVAVYHLNLWLHSLIELWAWRKRRRNWLIAATVPGTIPSGGHRMRIVVTLCGAAVSARHFRRLGPWRSSHENPAPSYAAW